jgi:long-subunit acyl-CoA synthetase (AMP-forming)
VLENSFNRAGKRSLDPWVGDTFVSILPCWHIFERTAEYFTLSRGVKMVSHTYYNYHDTANMLLLLFQNCCHSTAASVSLL